MKISKNWLKEYIDIDHSTDELKQILTFSGIEVEAVQELGMLPDTVVTARVLSADPLPKSDHLQVCNIDTGSETVQVVCGASNCRAGMIAVLALPGTDMGGFQIQKTKIRGVESSGMLCSEKELGLSEDHEGIIELAADIPIGMSVNELYGLPDVVFELEITPNRSDLLGYIGIARDLSASTGLPIKMPEPSLLESGTNAADELLVTIQNAKLCPRYTARVIRGVKVSESPQWLKNRLLRSGTRPINNVVDITNYVMLETGHPLHAFDMNCLKSSGNIKQIIVRNARPGEEIGALDSKTYKLLETDLVIADEFSPIAIAGVIGGANSQIDEATVDVVLESAAFHPSCVRRTAYRNKINTDSSYRFERHLSEYETELASVRAAELILLLAGGKLLHGNVDVWPAPQSGRILGIRPKRFESIIGYRMDGDQIIQYLSNLGLSFIQYANWKPGIIHSLDELYCFHAEQVAQGITEFSEDVDCIHTLYFRIPYYRIDLEREIDLIEELARLDGYDKVPQKTLISSIMDRHAHSIRRKLQDILVSCGAYETVSFSFVDPENTRLLSLDSAEADKVTLKLKNPQSINQSVMRTSLIPQLLRTMEYNLNHGQRNVRIFELNKVYLGTGEKSYLEPYRLSALFTGASAQEHWQEKGRMMDFFDLKGFVALILDSLVIQEAEFKRSTLPYLASSAAISCVCRDTEILNFGLIKPEIAATFGIDLIDLKQDLWLLDLDVEAIVAVTRDSEKVFAELPKFPAIERDISFLISASVSYEQINQKIMELDSSIIKSVSVFDEYRGKQVPEDMRSLSMHIVFYDSEKTLTVTRIDQLFESIQNMLQKEWQIRMR